MTEKSLFWPGETVGEATRAPYDDDEVREVLQLLLLADTNIAFGVVPDYLNELLVTNPAGTTIRVADGAAIVNGRLYLNDANVDTSVTAPGSDLNWYTYVLQMSESAQTIRIAQKGPNNSPTADYPSLTQSAATWEIPLAGVSITSGSVITITDARRFLRGGEYKTPLLPKRQGGSVADWQTAGNTNYDILEFLAVAYGKHTTTVEHGSDTITLPFTFDQILFVLLDMETNAASRTYKRLSLSSFTTPTSTIGFRLDTDALGSKQINWMVIGERVL